MTSEKPPRLTAADRELFVNRVMETLPLVEPDVVQQALQTAVEAETPPAVTAALRDPDLAAWIGVSRLEIEFATVEVPLPAPGAARLNMVRRIRGHPAMVGALKAVRDNHIQRNKLFYEARHAAKGAKTAQQLKLRMPEYAHLVPDPPPAPPAPPRLERRLSPAMLAVPHAVVLDDDDGTNLDVLLDIEREENDA